MLAMSQANRIRQFTVDNFIAPAIAAGRDEITIRAGDVHKEMGLTNAMPAVCSALGSRKFNEYANITRSALVGPANGANVYFTFKLMARPQPIDSKAATRVSKACCTQENRTASSARAYPFGFNGCA
jgi:hypothetical protein